MPSLLRDNLPYKLVALVFAVLLHFYVAGQQNPARVVTVPLAVRNLPPGLLLAEDGPRQVTLSLSGPSDVLDHAASAVVAYVDLGRAHAGKSIVAPVEVKTPEGIDATATPDTVVLSLSAKQKRRLAVAAADPGPALPGYRFLTPLVTPRYVTVAGSQDAVDSVARLVVKADAPAPLGTVDDDFDIVALDARGSQVEDVTLTPPRAHVSVRMVRAPALKNVLVSVDVTGAPAPGGRVDGIQVRPLTVVIAGRPERLDQITTVGTAPLDLTGAAGDVTRTVNCVAPPGVTLAGASAVVVTVHITSGNAPAPATTVPIPAPPSSPATPNGILPNGAGQGVR